MEYVPGVTLADKLKEFPNELVSEPIAASYMKSLFEAINHCHALDIVHGDIKSENIMITEGSNQVRLLDFGLSW